MQQTNLIQGSQEWLDFRAKYFTASEAPAMMGVSTYMTRTQLLEQKATGLVPEVDAATQRRFDRGHHIEALARPYAEKVIGDELYPVTGFIDGLSASFDGLTINEDIAWECKTLNGLLREAIVRGGTGADLPMQYQIQMEQQALVSGCEKILFTAADFDSNDQLVEIHHVWYTPNPELRAKIIAGWEQFKADLGNWKPEEKAPEVTAEQVDDLPTVYVNAQGSLTVQNNLDKFATALDYFLDKVLVKEPENDQDFADLEAQIKVLKRAEDELQSSETQLLAQVSAVNDAVTLKNKLYDLARQNRLASEKLVKAKKQEIKTRIVFDAQQQIKDAVATTSKELGFNIPAPADGIADAIKGKSKLDSIKEAAHNQVLNVLRDFHIHTQEIKQAVKLIDDADKPHLFTDRANLAVKGIDFVQLTIKTRLADEEARVKAAELRAQQAESERQERIKAEQEQSRLAKAEAQNKADQQVEVAQETKAATPLHGAHGSIAYNADGTKHVPEVPDDDDSGARPTDAMIIHALAKHFQVSEKRVIAWLKEMDFTLAELPL